MLCPFSAVAVWGRSPHLTLHCDTVASRPPMLSALASMRRARHFKAHRPEVRGNPSAMEECLIGPKAEAQRICKRHQTEVRDAHAGERLAGGTQRSAVPAMEAFPLETLQQSCEVRVPGSLPHTSHDALAGRHEAERTQLRATLRKFAAQSCKPRGLEHAAIFTLDAQGHHDLDGSLHEAGRSELFKAWLLRGCSKDVSQSEGFAEHSVQQKPCSPCPNICPQVK